ncbi:MAG: hypothetical protein DBX47_01285 [Clostridiales bacterium]|nr:MAG: hypothetical protein DBX47_01285 [Clostridiales bacterium]
MLICIIIFSFSSAFYGEELMKFTVEGASGGVGEIVTVNIKLSEKSNITEMLLTLYYDSDYLKFRDFFVGDILKQGIYEFNEKLDSRMKFAYISANPLIQGSTILSISFEIINAAENNKEVPLTLQIDEAANGNTALEYKVENGSVIIDNTQTLKRGDANGDGVFNMDDLEFVKNYILGKDNLAKNFDLNGDSVCDICEYIKLRDML